MISYLLLALIKVIDNLIGTAKNILVYKEEKVLSSILVVASQLIFYLIIDQVISDNTILSIAIVSVSSGVGNYVALHINEKLKRDDKWWIYITTSDMDFMNELCEYLCLNEIKYGALNGFDKKGEDSVHVIIFSKTKKESKLVQTFLTNSNKKHLLEIMK